MGPKRFAQNVGSLAARRDHMLLSPSDVTFV
jgi:hypothetical protein